jgi:hypothetical protein
MITRIAGFDQHFRHTGIVSGDTVAANVGSAEIGLAVENGCVQAETRRRSQS